MPYRLVSLANEKWRAEGPLYIATSGDGQYIQAGDDIYILAGSQPSKLLARLSVLKATPDHFRHRIDVTIGGPRSAVFFDNCSDAVSIELANNVTSIRREVHWLNEELTTQLTRACGAHDFSSSNPARWDAIAQQVRTTVARARRDGDPRSDLEIAEAFLRYNYVTSQLPGPAPVYQNAARQALGRLLTPRPSVPRRRYLLTAKAVQAGINEDLTKSMGHTPDTSRHQDILDQLRGRLKRMDLVPLYDGLVDCIIEAADADIYFEVKSTSPESVVSQVRAGLGQVLHYMWMDAQATTRAMRGHLVVEGPWTDQNESLRDFLESCLVRLTWSHEIPSLQMGDLESLRTVAKDGSSQPTIRGEHL